MTRNGNPHPARCAAVVGRSRRPGAACLLLGLLALPAGLLAQPWTAAGDEFRVNTSTVGQQAEPEIGTDASGNFVIVFNGEGQGDMYGILGQRYLADGTPAGSEFYGNFDIAGYQQRAAVGVRPDGRFVVVWDEYFGGVQRVLAERFEANGDNVGANFEISSSTTLANIEPKVAIQADNKFVVVWTAIEPPPPPLTGGEDPNREIHGRQFIDNVPQGSEFQVNTYTTDLQSLPAIAAADDGSFVVAWTSHLQDGDGDGIRAQRFNSGTGKSGAEFQVNSYTTGNQYSPAIGRTRDGGFVIAWSSNPQDGDSRGVYAQRFDATGGVLGGEFRVNVETVGPQGHASVIGSSAGGFLVAWEGPEIHARYYTAAGDPVGGQYQVNTYSTALQATPVVSGDAGGQFVVTWESFDQDGDKLGIYAQRLLGPIFIDGFESDDTSEWSDAIGL